MCFEAFILPGFTAISSATKHAAVMGSPRMTGAANNLWIRAAGE
jgi:hypothetical protein